VAQARAAHAAAHDIQYLPGFNKLRKVRDSGRAAAFDLARRREGRAAHRGLLPLGPRAALDRSNMQPEEAGNCDYDDHDADNVENIHCVLRSSACTASKEGTALE
jgi:hypothetical protein